MAGDSGRIQFESQFQVSPITLSGGIAAQQSGGVLGIASLLPQNFATFKSVQGASLLKNQCATYPFANSRVAGNALIADPLTLSMQMICPASGDGVGYLAKSSVISSLVSSLNQHNSQGGLYTVYTPAFTYPDGVLLDIRDVTPDDQKQKQVVYQWDFYFPLLTLAAAQAAQSALMQTLTNGTPITGTPSWSTGATDPSQLSQPASALTPATIQ